MNVASECSVGEKLTEDDTGRIRANLILFYFNAFGFLLHAKCTAYKKKHENNRRNKLWAINGSLSIIFRFYMRCYSRIKPISNVL